MGKSITAKNSAASVPALIELNSDSSDWCTEWPDVSKCFYITVYDSDKKPVSGVAVGLETLEATDGKPELTLMNRPVTNANGVAIAFCRIKAEAGQYAVVAVHSATQLQSSPMILNMKASELPAPRIPAAFDSIIDDYDYANSVMANVIGAQMQRGSVVYLLWGDNMLQQILTEDDNSCPFFLTGRGIVPDERLFQNQSYRVRAFVVDPAGNGSFSTQILLGVSRTHGGGALPFCEPLDIPQGDDGLLNQEDILNGVTINIPNGPLILNGHTQAEHQLTEATAASISLKALNNDGVTINTLNIPLNVVNIPAEDDPYPYQDTPDPRQPTALKDFLMSIGAGSIMVSYNVTIKNYTYSVTKERSYEVDVSQLSH
ncbi:hypothetical protein ROS60_002730 [Pluralibacter gergoviae]|uniref:hypothetical protein n=1 Tax=Pluralibacter gergoviae TaxID=61647 RepID=UPI0004F84769|nr:hypothetical protein [Pluralibacter gergoviae]AIQ99706.1 hypothetical protein LG71_07280 [Pluralibacter gergoviae]ELG9930153.1 hypothetical protein [Pluralibacter gergoviae]ELK5593104.1 hypothetical protein [Pluralibacter gergoviae]ELO7477620.1 hypothetical protein [Pluralibacter gergoviae]ELW9440025.1 hypothetical protein [Pluralibacter gergoviae]